MAEAVASATVNDLWICFVCSYVHLFCCWCCCHQLSWVKENACKNILHLNGWLLSHTMRRWISCLKLTVWKQTNNHEIFNSHRQNEQAYRVHVRFVFDHVHGSVYMQCINYTHNYCKRWLHSDEIYYSIVRSIDPCMYSNRLRRRFWITDTQFFRSIWIICRGTNNKER